MLAKKKAMVHITMIVIMVQTEAKNKGPRKILGVFVSKLFLQAFLSLIYLLYRKSTDNFVRPKVNVEVIKEA